MHDENLPRFRKTELDTVAFLDLTRLCQERYNLRREENRAASLTAFYDFSAAPNAPATRTTNSSTNTTTTSSAGGNASNGANGNNCKYCNCCYCEFFGNGGPAQAPTSRNYLEMRERLLRKLKTKGQENGLQTLFSV